MTGFIFATLDKRFSDTWYVHCMIYYLLKFHHDSIATHTNRRRSIPSENRSKGEGTPFSDGWRFSWNRESWHYHKLRRQPTTVCAENSNNALKCIFKTPAALSRRVVRGVYANPAHLRAISARGKSNTIDSKIFWRSTCVNIQMIHRFEVILEGP